MRFQVQARSLVRGLVGATLLGAALWLTGCSSGMQLRVTTAHNLNSPSKDRGHRLAYRIVQFKEMPSLAGSQFPAVWKNEDKVLPGVVGKAVDGTFDPDTTVTVKVKQAPGAKAFAIIGNYYKPQGECWYLVQAFGRRGTAVVTAGASCFAPGTAR